GRAPRPGRENCFRANPGRVRTGPRARRRRVRREKGREQSGSLGGDDPVRVLAGRRFSTGQDSPKAKARRPREAPAVSPQDGPEQAQLLMVNGEDGFTRFLEDDRRTALWRARLSDGRVIVQD